MSVEVRFANDDKGKFAAKLFNLHGTEELGNLLQFKAAAMLNVFSYSQGLEDLVQNLYEVGSTAQGLNPKKLENSQDWSIRVNDAIRIRFRWEDGMWKSVGVGNYH